MTLKNDIEQILASVPVDVPDFERLLIDEHERYRFYLSALSMAPKAKEREIITLVLRDPDRVMADAALVAHVGSQASEARSADSFTDWSANVADLMDQRTFLARRVREWQLLKRLIDGEEVDADIVAASSDWLQRKAAAEVSSSATLATLAEVGRTKRVRNLARNRADRAQRGSAP